MQRPGKNRKLTLAQLAAAMVNQEYGEAMIWPGDYECKRVIPRE
jgi:hypothetical protein